MTELVFRRRVLLTVDLRDRDDQGCIVDKIPDRGVTDVLMALDPRPGFVTNPRSDRHDESIDLAVCPLL